MKTTGHATAEALAAIPAQTVRHWPDRRMHGTQPHQRRGTLGKGPFRFHTLGCRVDGGDIPRSRCGKCCEDLASVFLRAYSAESRR